MDGLLKNQNNTRVTEVLDECKTLLIKKGEDYQNPNSSVKQAMHYRRGVDSIHDFIHQKVLRAQSILESGVSNTNYESLEDTYKDIINYCAMSVAYLRGNMDGQSPDRDIFNKPVNKY